MTTKDKIITASIKNFLIWGYEKTSLSMIAEDIGIKKPSIYYYFRSKEDLFTTCINYIMDSLEKSLTDSIKNIKSSKQMLESIFTTLFEFNSNLSLLVGNSYDKPVNMLNLLHLGINRFCAVKERIDRYYDTLKNVFIKMIEIGKKDNKIRKDLDTNALALELIAWIEGLFALSTVYSSFNINTMRNSLYNNMWKTIAMPESQKNGFFKKKPFSKTISLGTKW
ncbi:TetR/AcrR family transcriptional regulator [Clostridiaceae bacterium M8S5]|nr:TetR/AcrR family transcriptional regulator [Clostridiaceae bacterium M8S5]